MADGRKRIGMPGAVLLDLFGLHVHSVFGHYPYHVGSSLAASMGEHRAWSDVDVRLMLPDDEYAAMGLGDPRWPRRNRLWMALAVGFSAIGQQMTGLPIDFQIQEQSHGNEKSGKAPRSALGATWQVADGVSTTLSVQRSSDG